MCFSIDDDDEDEVTVDVEKCLKSSPPSHLPTHLNYSYSASLENDVTMWDRRTE